MSKSHSRSSGRRSSRRRDGSRKAPDRTIYLGLALIGAFALAIGFLISPDNFRTTIVGFLIAAFGLVNFYSWRAFLGASQANWQNALARIPLRFAGYGVRGGKPVEAAAGAADARSVLLVFLAVSIIIVVVATTLLVPVSA